MTSKIAVVGAGLSGLCTIKELLEAGHDVVCFEKSAELGGVFSSTGTYDSVSLTVSNYFMAYSDFMPYDEKIRYWTRAEYKAYLERYAAFFNLKDRIQFNCTIESIDDFADGQWQVRTKGSDGTSAIQIFDRVAVCCGQFQKPNIPELPGLQDFTGSVIHSSQYKSAKDNPAFVGKRVLCFGMGESAADIVTEISQVAQSTTLSLRRRHMFAPRMVGDRTIDTLQSRFWHCMPAAIKAEAVRNHWRNVLRQEADPVIHLLAQHNIESSDEPGSVVTKTERIFEAQANGMEIDIGGVTKIEGSNVYFSSGKIMAFDTIMLCTGFQVDFPFLPEKYQFSNMRDCYLHCYHPRLRDRLVFVGFARPQQGGIPLISELLARYFALICSGERSLPDDLAALAAEEQERWSQEFYETPRVAGLVNGFRFNETVADLIGCRPPIPSLLQEPRAFFIYWFHHVQPSQYRLVGPGAREEAREHWKNVPCSHFDAAVISRRKKLVLLLKMFSIRLQSLFQTDELSQWRPLLSKPQLPVSRIAVNLNSKTIAE